MILERTSYQIVYEQLHFCLEMILKQFTRVTNTEYGLRSIFVQAEEVLSLQ